MSSEKRSTDVTEPTPNVDSPVKKKVKTDEEEGGTNGEAPAATDEMVVEKDTNGTAEETTAEPETEDAVVTTEAEASNWTPPPFGAVCWIQIPATDVARAKTFYETAFDFEFKGNPPGYKDEDIAMFKLKNADTSLTGGICKADANTSPGNGTILYFMVPDVDEALEKIKGLGGKTKDEKKPEGEHGLVGLFEDTEGNVQGVYQLKSMGGDKTEE